MNNTIESIGNKCTACRSCEQICPKKAIKMVENEEGFIYPNIDKSKCINCGLCKNRCHIFNDFNVNYEQKVYAVKNIDKKLSKQSTSAGLAHILAEYFVRENGCVCGASYDKEFNVNHIIVKDIKDLIKLRGSKYVISNTCNTFQEINKILMEGKPVLYTGTGCQIAGLKSYLKEEYENLYTIDIVCHGVPSQKVFKKYIDYLGKKINDKVVKYDFRNKEKVGWGLGFCAKVTTKSKEKYIKADFDPYYTNFLNGSLYRESCYQCKYANINNRPADITIADFWGIEKIKPKFYDESGVSLCIINNCKGEKLLEFIKDKIIVEESNKSQAIKENINLIKPTERPSIRDWIYKDIDKLDSEQYIKQKLTIKKDIKIYIKNILPSFVKKMYKMKINK